MKLIEKALSRNSACLFIITIATLTTYFHALDCPFVLDDFKIIERNIKIRDVAGFFQFNEIFGARPLVNFSFSLDYLMSGLNIKTYHLTNLIIHLLNAFLVFHLTALIVSLCRTNKVDDFSINYLAPFFAAALFALHPIQTQAVIYISQRATVLACFFYLLSVICYIHARRLKAHKNNLYRYAGLFLLCGLFAAFAFLSKKNTASIPAAIFLIEILFFGQTPWKKKLPVMICLIGMMVLAFAWFAKAFQGNFSLILDRLDQLTRETNAFSRWQYLSTEFTVILIYLRLIVFPKGLNIDHGYMIKTSFFDGFTPYALVLITGIILVAVLSAKRNKILCFGILWFFIALSVESSIIPIRDPMFEHRVYLAFPGICIISAYFLSQIQTVKLPSKILIITFILISCVVMTIFRIQVWESELSLWQDAAQKAPHNVRALNNYGNALLSAGQLNAAVDIYQKAIAVNPQYARPYCNLGEIYAQNGDLKTAKLLFKKSIELDSRFEEAHNNLAIIYASEGDMQKGISHFKKTLDIDNNRAVTHYNLGKAYLDTNQPDKALQHLFTAIQMKADIQNRCYYLAGAAYAVKNDPGNAAIWVHQAKQRGLQTSSEDVKKDPRFNSCRKIVLDILTKM